MESDRVYRLRREVRFRTVGDEGVVLRQVAREVLVVNGVGARILELVDGRRDVAGVVDALAAERETPREVVAADVAEFLDELLVAGVVEEVAGERSG